VSVYPEHARDREQARNTMRVLPMKGTAAWALRGRSKSSDLGTEPFGGLKFVPLRGRVEKGAPGSQTGAGAKSRAHPSQGRT